MSETQIIQHQNGINGVAAHIRQATDVAGACREIVKATAQRIGNRDYVRVEGWQSIAVGILYPYSKILPTIYAF